MLGLLAPCFDASSKSSSCVFRERPQSGRAGGKITMMRSNSARASERRKSVNVVYQKSRYSPEASDTSHGTHRSSFARPNTAPDASTPFILLAKNIKSILGLRSASSIASGLLPCSRDEDICPAAGGVGGGRTVWMSLYSFLSFWAWACANVRRMLYMKM